MNRPEWDDYFLGIAGAVAARADCRRRRVGAVIVSGDHRIISTGYNGAPSGQPGCLDGHCPRGLLTTDEVAPFTDYSTPGTPGYCISIHAELNALLWSSQLVKGCTMYVTCEPCPACRKNIAGAGISRCVWPDGETSTR